MTYMVAGIIFTFYFYTILYTVAFILDTSKKRIRIRWGVEVIGWLNLCFFFFFLFTACTLIIFFFRIVRIYVLSLLFLVYSVYMNHFFFLLYCKNLCTFFTFFGLQCVYINHFFLSYCKNLYTFFVLFTACTSIIFFFHFVL